MKKIAIIGSGGAGKSTLAITLAEQMTLPLHHLDRLYWRPNWQRAEPVAWASLHNSFVPKKVGLLMVTILIHWIFVSRLVIRSFS
mgnify:CR=1 FL=1